MQPKLGPFQCVWDKWQRVHDLVMAVTPDNFQTTILVQLLEVREALATANREHAAEELVDLISVALNWLRWLGLTDEGVAEVVRTRSRKYGNPAILQEYKIRYGL